MHWTQTGLEHAVGQHECSVLQRLLHLEGEWADPGSTQQGSGTRESARLSRPVEWMYPARALIDDLQSNTSHLPKTCVHKAVHWSQYLRGKPRELRLLVWDSSAEPEQVQ